MKRERSKVAYIEPNDEGKPNQTLSQLADDLSYEAFMAARISTANRPGKGRRKVRITVTVEAVE